MDKLDSVDFANDFENWLEQQYPFLTVTERAEASRRVMEFIEARQE